MEGLKCYNYNVMIYFSINNGRLDSFVLCCDVFGIIK